MFTSRRKQYFAWIALFAFLYAAFTPVLMGVRAQSQPDFIGALCTLGGIKQAPADPVGPAQDGASHQPQCVYGVAGAWQSPHDASLSLPLPLATDTSVSAITGRTPFVSSAALQPLSPRAPPRLV